MSREPNQIVEFHPNALVRAGVRATGLDPLLVATIYDGSTLESTSGGRWTVKL